MNVPCIRLIHQSEKRMKIHGGLRSGSVRHASAQKIPVVTSCSVHFLVFGVLCHKTTSIDIRSSHVLPSDVWRLDRQKGSQRWEHIYLVGHWPLIFRTKRAMRPVGYIIFYALYIAIRLYFILKSGIRLDKLWS